MNDECKHELSSLLNKYGIDNLCNTPDFILAEYLHDCILSYKAVKERNEKWHGFGPQICSSEPV